MANSTDGSIRYSDLIIPDDAVNNLIAQLEKLGQTYDNLVKDIQAQSRQMEQALGKASAATQQGQESIRRMAQEAERLYGEYNDARKVSQSASEQLKIIKELEQSLNREIGTRQRNSLAMAEETRLMAQAKASLTAYQKALRSGEQLTSKQLAEYATLNARISEHTNLRNKARTALSQETKEMQYADGSIRQLQAKVAELSKTYAGMGQRMRNSPAGEALLDTLQKQYAELSKLEQAMGVYRRNVGNYASAWNGLNVSVQQVVRELPSLSMGFNIFFLAISNNLPMLTDGIKAATEAYKQAVAQGQKATPVWKQLLSSIVSWQTALIVGITLLTQYGDEIIDWVKGLFTAKSALDGIREPLAEVNGQITLETNKLSSLAAQLQKTTKGSDEWRKVKNTIVDRYGQYLDGLNDEINSVGNLSRAYDKLVESMRHTMAMKGLKDFADKQDAKTFKSIADSYLEISENIRHREGFEEKDIVAYMKWIREYVETGEWKSFKEAQAQGKLTQEQYNHMVESVFSRGGENAIREARRSYFQNEQLKRTYASALGVSGQDYDKLMLGIDTRPDNEKTLTEVVNGIIAVKKEIDALRAKPLVNISEIERAEKRLNDLKELFRTMVGEDFDVKKRRKKPYKPYQDDLDARRAYQDALGRLISDEYDRRRYQTTLQYNREIEDIQHRLDTEKNLTEDAQKNLTAQMVLIAEQRNDALEQIEKEHQIQLLELEKQGIEARMQGLNEETDQYRTLQNKLFSVNNRLALARNEALPAGERQDPQQITAASNREAAAYNYQFELDKFDEYLEEAYDKDYKSEKAKTAMRLQMEKERWEKIMQLTEKYGSDVTGYQVGQIKESIGKIDGELSKLGKGWDPEQGVFGNLFDMVLGNPFGSDAKGLEKEQAFKDSISTSVSYAMDALQQFADYKAELADRAVESAEKEVDAAQSVLDAELQARANGYANNVQQAQKELALAKKNQRQALLQQQQAQRQQQAIQSLEQIGNMVTATSLIWSQLGFPAAIPATAIMWASFAASKIKAAQLAKQSIADMGTATEKYGEGTVELLQGGSHQSGNDIDLGRKPDGTRRRAEGGEFFAVINKRSSRRFRSVIPDVINSLNDGSFAHKYLNAYKGAAELDVELHRGTAQSPDLSALSGDVRAIRRQGDRRTYTDGRGRTVIEYGLHRRRIINNN